MPVKVPNLRNPEERNAYRADIACTDPKVAGDQLLPCLPGGSMEYPDEVYEAVRNQWIERTKEQ